MSLDFGPLIITDAHGRTHSGIRPSLLKRPFARVGLALPGARRECRYPAGLTPVGFDAAVNVSIDPCAPADTVVRFRLVALMPDGRRWHNLYDHRGNLVDEGWM